MRPIAHLLLSFGLLLLSSMCSATPIVAAASSLKFALDEIEQRYFSVTGQHVRLVYGSSGNLYRQIRQGAPFAIFLSADPRYIDQLAAEELVDSAKVEYGHGRLVLFVPIGSPLYDSVSLEALATAVRNGRLGRFAIANPQHAPYGRAAMHLLRILGIDELMGPKLVFGENVAQATQFAVSRSVDGVITAYSLVLVDRVADTGRFIMLDRTLYPPMSLPMVQLKTRGIGEESQDFFDFLQGDEAAAIFRRHGLKE